MGNGVESTAFSSGMAVICNDRLDDIPYEPLGEQAYLAEPMVIKFVDEHGNAHHIEFSYGPQDSQVIATWCPGRW